MPEQLFPDPEERARIIARRNQLQRDLIEYAVTRSAEEQEARTGARYVACEKNRTQRSVSLRQRPQVQALPRQVTIYFAN